MSLRLLTVIFCGKTYSSSLRNFAVKSTCYRFFNYFMDVSAVFSPLVRTVPLAVCSWSYSR